MSPDASEGFARSVEVCGLVDLRRVKSGIAPLGDRPIDMLEHRCGVDSEASGRLLNRYA